MISGRAIASVKNTDGCTNGCTSRARVVLTLITSRVHGASVSSVGHSAFETCASEKASAIGTRNSVSSVRRENRPCRSLGSIAISAPMPRQSRTRPPDPSVGNRSVPHVGRIACRQRASAARIGANAVRASRSRAVFVRRKTRHPSATSAFCRARSSSKTRRDECGTKPSNSTAILRSGHARSICRFWPPTPQAEVDARRCRAGRLELAQDSCFPLVAGSHHVGAPVLQEVQHGRATWTRRCPERASSRFERSHANDACDECEIERVLELRERHYRRDIDHGSRGRRRRNALNCGSVDAVQLPCRSHAPACTRACPTGDQHARLVRVGNQSEERRCTQVTCNAAGRQHAGHDTLPRHRVVIQSRRGRHVRRFPPTRVAGAADGSSPSGNRTRLLAAA